MEPIQLRHPAAHGTCWYRRVPTVASKPDMNTAVPLARAFGNTCPQVRTVDPSERSFGIAWRPSRKIGEKVDAYSLLRVSQCMGVTYTFKLEYVCMCTELPFLQR